MKYRSFYQSCQGHSHVEGNMPCQDASISWANEKATVIIVSDGHGNVRHLRSQIGSTIACDTALFVLKEYLNNPEQRLEEINRYRSSSLNLLKESILAAWYDAVHVHYADHPFTQDELDRLCQENLSRYADDYKNGIRIERAYGCTLVALVITEEFWLALQLGDGEIAITDGKGYFSFPLSEDDLSIGETTHSLCETDAKQHFAHAWGTELPVAAFVYTDGIQKAFPKQSMDLMDMLTWSGNVLQSGQDGGSSLQNYLTRLAIEGTPKDDVSLAMFIAEGTKLPKAEYSRKQIEREIKKSEILLNECRAVLSYNKQTLESLESTLENADDIAKVQLKSDIEMIQQILEKERANENRILESIEQWKQFILSRTKTEEITCTETEPTTTSSQEVSTVKEDDTISKENLESSSNSTANQATSSDTQENPQTPSTASSKVFAENKESLLLELLHEVIGRLFSGKF